MTGRGLDLDDGVLGCRALVSGSAPPSLRDPGSRENVLCPPVVASRAGLVGLVMLPLRKESVVAGMCAGMPSRDVEARACVLRARAVAFCTSCWKPSCRFVSYPLRPIYAFTFLDLVALEVPRPRLGAGSDSFSPTMLFSTVPKPMIHQNVEGDE
ncbi:hypothetical protein NDU88_005259 [Pleurodeles waltl]|uniref:Uncharacterized protein n=1 Tax=Pleurodeles waltl TaxID=8319 RepID=A0AAV7WY54_PLEWA|nr:hypothetical protein NDU88_005259 [Pleurodeles waltl]